MIQLILNDSLNNSFLKSLISLSIALFDFIEILLFLYLISKNLCFIDSDGFLFFCLFFRGFREIDRSLFHRTSGVSSGQWSRWFRIEYQIPHIVKQLQFGFRMIMASFLFLQL